MSCSFKVCVVNVKMCLFIHCEFLAAFVHIKCSESVVM